MTILAGGTDLMPQSQAGRVKLKRHAAEHPPHPANCAASRCEGDEIRIGALATITEIMAATRWSASTCRCWSRPATISPATRSATPARSAATSATPRRPATRWCRCWCSTPRSSWLHARTTPHRAAAACRSPTFFVGPGRTRRAAGELLAGVRIPLPPAGHRRALLQVRHATGARHLDDLDRRRRRAHGRRAVATCASPSARWRRRRCARARTEAGAGRQAARRRDHRARGAGRARRSPADRRRARQRLVPQGNDPQHDARGCSTMSLKHDIDIHPERRERRARRCRST